MILPSAKGKNRYLYAGAGVALALVLLYGVIIPVGDASDDMERKTVETKKDLQKVTELADKYITLSATLPPAMRLEGANVSIQSSVDAISRRMGMEKNMERMVPSVDQKTKEESLSLLVNNLPYTKLVEFLRAVYESGSPISVKRAKITTSFDNKDNVSADIIFVKAN
jgi:type II secretory pathway component PulM